MLSMPLLKASPFFANYGFHPRFEFLESTQPSVPAAEDHIVRMQDITRSLISELQSAQEAYKHFADHHQTEPPAFSPGDKVWLLRRNIKTQHPSDKLDYQEAWSFYYC